MGVVAGIVSSMLDNFATALSFFSLHSVAEGPLLSDSYFQAFTVNGNYWKVVAYCSALTGNVLAIGSVSGVALLKLERMPLMWYFRNVGVNALAGWAAGLVLMILAASFA